MGAEAVDDGSALRISGSGSHRGDIDRTIVCSIVKLVVQVKLLPTPEQAAALEATLHAVNTAADLVSAVAFDQRCFRNYDLREHTYDRIKAECGLAAQAAQHVIKKVADAYRTFHANLRARERGRAGGQAEDQGREQADHLPAGRGPALRRSMPVLADAGANGVDLDHPRAVEERCVHRLT